MEPQVNMKTKYIFLDIDGTLYSTKLNGTPDSAVRAIDEARANGHRVFLCTGRSLAECSKYLGYKVDGYVFAAGALVYVQDKKWIFNQPFSKEEVLALKKLIHEYNMGYCAEGLAGAYCDGKGYEFILRYFKGSAANHRENVRNAQENAFYTEAYEHDDDPIYKICAYDYDWDNFMALKDALPEGFTLTMTVRDVVWQNHCGEITNAKITKSTGISHVLDYYKAGYQDAVAIGDSGNDIPMIRDCGIGIAMGNAFEAVKNAADWVTTDILDDGIYHAFQHIGVIQ
jgi:Cof subfamily protein (haloacid dehalogenase superfamily)